MAYFAAAMAAIQIASSVAGGQKVKKGNKAAVKLTDIKNRQRVRAFLRNFRAQQANQVAFAGANIGGLDSSRAQGAITSQRSQAFSGVVEATQIGKLNRKIAKAGAQAQQFSLVSSVAGTASRFFASEAGRDMTGSD